jgi:streptogramin lyase
MLARHPKREDDERIRSERTGATIDMTATRLLRTTLALLVAAALTPALASAAPAVNGEFDLSGKPAHLAQGPDGNIWVAMTDSTLGNDIAKVTPAGAVTEFDLPVIIDTYGIVAGPDGNMWATHLGGVFKFAPANPVGGTDFPVAQISDPRPIVVGPDSNLWTATGANAIKITTAGVATPFPVTGMNAHDIARGGDGNLYVADGNARVVGLTTAGVPTFYATGGNLQGVAAGPGTQIAYTNPVNTPEQIGRITPGNPTPLITDQPNIDPTGIVLGSDGAYWIANFNSTSLTRFTTDGTVTSLAGLSVGSGARYITTGPGNTLWVGLETAKKVARVTGIDAPSSGGGSGGGGGGSTPPPADRTPPTLSKLSLSKLLRLGATATIRVTLSEPATLTLRFERVLSGRRAKSGRCVAPTRKLRKAHGCTRFVSAGSFTRSAGAGAAKLSFDGHVGRRKLGVGSYRLTIVAKDAAGNVGRSVSARFAIAPKKKPHRAHR